MLCSPRSMARPGNQTGSKKHDQIVVIDLGTRSTRAVLLAADGEGLRLLNFSVQEAPASADARQRKDLAAHLKNVVRTLGARTRKTILVVGMGDVILRTLELPMMHLSEMREALRLNTGKFFHQDVSQFTFDCSAIPSKPGVTIDLEEVTHYVGQSQILVGGAENELIKTLRAAAKDAGLRPLQIVPSQVSLANAALLGMPEALRTEVVAVVDVGFRAVTISVLVHGKVVLTRGVEIKDELNRELEEALTIPYPVAEDIKQKLVLTKLQKVLFGLGQDICSAMDYFEAQLDLRISQGFFSSGSERADLIFEIVQKHLDFPCQKLDPSGQVTPDLPPEKRNEAAGVLPQLATAVGAAAAWFKPELVRLNLLAEDIEARARRRRDPVRWSVGIGAAAVVLLLAYAGLVQIRSWQADGTLNRCEQELKSLNRGAVEAAATLKKANEIGRIVTALEQHATNRFLCAPALNALQHTVMDDVQFVQLAVQQNVLNVNATKPTTKDGVAVPGKPGCSKERVALTVQAKCFGTPQVREKFMEAMVSHPYFRENLQKPNPIVLKNFSPRQVDPLDPSKVFSLFTIECLYPERILGYE